MKRTDEPLSGRESVAALNAMAVRIFELTGKVEPMETAAAPYGEAEYIAAMQAAIDRIAELEAMMKSRGGVTTI